MKQSLFYKILSKSIRKKILHKPNLNNRKEVALIFNSNPWFSAVSDYSLQLGLYLKMSGHEVLYCAQKKHTKMDLMCKKNNLKFKSIPIHKVTFFYFIIAFVKIIFMLSSKVYLYKNIYVFEGREHTLFVLSKLFFPFLWHKKSLIRIRGQTQEIKNNFLSKIVYKYYTNKIIFSAKCLLDKVPFNIPPEKTLIQYYCKNINFINQNLQSYEISNNIPIINFQNLTFLILGRLDPVKGHEIAIQAFINSNLLAVSQLIIIGLSENIKAINIFKKYASQFDTSLQFKNYYFLEKNLKRIYILDEKMEDMNKFMQNVHFGIIPSLDSEVICRVGVEFLQNKIPCLFSNAGALPEVFQDFPNLGFIKNNVNSLQLAIENAQKIWMQSEEYKLLKLNAHKIGIDKYDLKNFQNIL